MHLHLRSSRVVIHTLRLVCRTMSPISPPVARRQSPSPPPQMSCVRSPRSRAPMYRRAISLTTPGRRRFGVRTYPRLAEVKKKYDPAGLFFVHHGVGSEEWSADGVTTLAW